MQPNGDMVNVRFNAPAAGTYFIGINFSTRSLFGDPLPARNRSLRLHNDGRAGFDQRARSRRTLEHLNVVAAPLLASPEALRRRVGASCIFGRSTVRDGAQRRG